MQLNYAVGMVVRFYYPASNGDGLVMRELEIERVGAGFIQGAIFNPKGDGELLGHRTFTTSKMVDEKEVKHARAY